MSRSREYEAQALAAIGAQAKADTRTTNEYAKVVWERLEHGAREYGDDGWWRRGIDSCIKEIGDEGSDLAGWVLGALQVLRDEVLAGRIPRDEGHLAQHLLLQAAAFGLQAWMSAEMARDAIREATGRTDSPDRFTRAISDPGD